MFIKIRLILILFVIIFHACGVKNNATQNPSPMEEHIRPHERVDGSECRGIRLKLDSLFVNPIDVFILDHLTEGDTVDLVIHFHGSPIVTEWAACSNGRNLVVVSVNLGSGSSTYERPFSNTKLFQQLLLEFQSILEEHSLIGNRTILSGFSAGYGAIRAILNKPKNHARVDGVLLLDGLHTDYVPEDLVLAKGGSLNTSKLEPFLDFAKLAVNGKKEFLFTHSSIFPGTFASTTECADYLINELGLSRKPVLKQGPLGMQQVGLTEKGKFKVLAFAGNTAPDHIDHLHGFYYFIELLL